MVPKPFFYIITMSTIVSFIYYKKFMGSKYVWFLYFIFFTFFIDKINYVNRIFHFFSVEGKYTNIPIINTYIIITFLFFFLFFKSIFHNKKNKQLMNLFLGIHTLLIISDLFIIKIDFFTEYLSKTLIFDSILLVITLILISFEFLKNKNIVDNIEKSFLFWIVLGCFLFYTGLIPILVFSKLNLSSNIFNNTLTILNTFTHLSFVVGLIVSEKKYNY